MFYADLHLHSYYSDGSDSIEDIVKKASAAHLKAIAITDHDTFCQKEQYKVLEKKYGLEIIPALEFSCQDPLTAKKVHILAYNIDENAIYTKQLLEKFQKHANNIRYQMAKSISYLDLNELL